MKLFQEKLKSSGLSPYDARQLGITKLRPMELKKLLPNAPKMPAMRFRYYNVSGKPREDIFRVRLLGSPPPFPFGAERPMRYMQNADSPPAAYFPRIVPWKDISQDPKIPILFTEGELKASCACKHNFPTIGLGGVWSWKSKALAWGLLPELESFVWAARTVVVCYDSDQATNPAIAAASAALCRELKKRGALTASTHIPSSGTLKVGLDDFVLAHGPAKLKELINTTESDEVSLALAEFNGRYVLVREPDVLYDEYDHVKLNPHKAAGSTLANVRMTKIVKDTPKEVLVYPEWLAWEARRECKRFTYRPGMPTIHNKEYNLWRGWGCEEKKGDITLWIELLDHVMRHCTVAERLWFERWVAYPIQHPGTKMVSACCFWANAQGVGKSFAGLLIGDVYGQNFSEISQGEFVSSFTHWGIEKQFILVDDVNTISRTEQRDHASRLKTLISQESFKANIKYVANYVLPDCINYYLTSNNPDALLLDEDDRRFFINHVPEKKEAKPKKWFDRIDDWRKSGEAAPALLYHFRHLDLGDQDRYTRPPESKAKLHMKLAGRQDTDQWALDLRDSPSSHLKVGLCALKSDLYTPSELYSMYAATYGSRTSMCMLGASLQRAGFEQRMIRVNSTSRRLWAVRDCEAWACKSPVAWADHYMKFGGDAK
jgi:hypothetical protein